MTRHVARIVSIGILMAMLTDAPGFAQVRTSPPPDNSRAVVVATSDQPGILTPRGRFLIEPSLDYTNSSSNRVALIGYTIIPAIVVGSIDIREVNRDMFVAALAARLGLTNRMEVEAKFPYVSRSDTTRSRDVAQGSVTDSVFSAGGRGRGDIELALRYQMNDGTGGHPYFISNLRVKSHTGIDPFQVESDPSTGLPTELPTGSGFWSLQPSLSMIYPSDPAVLFMNASYLWNIHRDFGGAIGNVDQGDAIELNLGMGFALNERMSFSMGYDHSVYGKDRQHGFAVPNSIITQVGRLLLGYSFLVDNKTRFNFSLGIGLTAAAPGVEITIRVPMCCFEVHPALSPQTPATKSEPGDASG